jgi:hypothetical protein
VTADPSTHHRPRHLVIFGQRSMSLVAFARQQRCSWHPEYTNGRGTVTAPASCREPCTDRWNWPSHFDLRAATSLMFALRLESPDQRC